MGIIIIIMSININPLMISLTILIKSHKQKHREIFDGEMLIKTLPPTLLQIFCEIFHISKVIVKSIVDPDDNFWMNS